MTRLHTNILNIYMLYVGIVYCKKYDNNNTLTNEKIDLYSQIQDGVFSQISIIASPNYF